MSITEIFDKIIASRVQKTVGIVATVSSVDMIKKTCDVIALNDTPFFDVRLTASITGALVYYIKPTIGSFVIIQMISDNDYYVSMFSNFDEIFLGDGSFGGMAKVIPLTTKLNNLESKVNTIISNFNGHVHAGVSAGAASTAVTTSTVSGSLTPTLQAEIENTTVAHGI